MKPGLGLYWHLSAYYFSYFATVGTVIAFWGLYLQDRGFNAVAIGQMMAIIAATKIVAPYIWGWLADRSGKRLRMIRYASFAAVIAFVGVFAASGFGWMALAMLLFGFFWNAGLPQFEATTLDFLGDQHHRYSIIRSGGSVGFVVAVLLIGLLLDEHGLDWLPFIILLLLAGSWLSSLAIGNDVPVQADAGSGGSIWKVLRQRPVRLVLLAGFLMQLSFGPYYTFFSIYLKAYGHGETMVGILWVSGTAAEVIIFYFMHRILPAYSVKALLILCFILACLRWVLIGHFVDSLPIIIFAQLLHAFTFGMFHAVMIHLIHHLFTGRRQGRGQGLYSSLSFGAGAASGALISGYLWDSYGAEVTFTLAACVAALGAMIIALGPAAHLWLPHRTRTGLNTP